MRKLLVFSDLHITHEGETIIGLDPARRFTEALEHARTHHPDADRAVLLGDLTHHGTPAQYARLKHLLGNCPFPLTKTIGNHDDRDAFRAAFPEVPTAEGFVQTAFDLGSTRVLVLDTVDHTGTVPRHAGYLCDERLDWLDRSLAAAGQRDLVVMCHHPPFRTGFPGMDAIRLVNGETVLDRLRAYPGALHLICGHVHRTISGSAGGIGFSVLKSPCHQMPMRLGDPSSGSSVDEPGAYAVVLAGPDGTIVHVHEVGQTSPDAGTDDASL